MSNHRKIASFASLRHMPLNPPTSCLDGPIVGREGEVCASGRRAEALCLLGGQGMGGGGACMGRGVMLTYGGAPGAQGVTWRCIQGSEARPPASRG